MAGGAPASWAALLAFPAYPAFATDESGRSQSPPPPDAAPADLLIAKVEQMDSSAVGAMGTI